MQFPMFEAEIPELFWTSDCFSESVLEGTGCISSCIVGPLPMTGQWGAKSGAKHPPCWQNFPGLHLGVVLFCQRKVESLGGQNGQNPSRFCWGLVELSPQILYNLRGYTLWRVPVCFHSSSCAKPVRFTWTWVMSIQRCELPVLITLTPWTARWFLCSAHPEFRGKATQAWMDEWIHNPQQRFSLGQSLSILFCVSQKRNEKANGRHKDAAIKDEHVTQIILKYVGKIKIHSL